MISGICCDLPTVGRAHFLKLQAGTFPFGILRGAQHATFNTLPKYRKHSSDNARVTISGRDYLLGPHGTEASKREYDRLMAEYLASGRSRSFGVADDLSMCELMLDYLACAKQYYGTGPCSEWHRIKLVLFVQALYGKHPAADFGPRQFKSVRHSMISDGLSRSGINARMKRIVRMFRWAASEELVPAAVHETLRLVPSLKPGKD